jgi:hypothetical protein
MRESFVFYQSFYESLKHLPPENFVRTVCAICEYSLYDKTPDMQGIDMAVFTLIKPQIDANNRKYENGKKGGEHGVKGGRPPSHKETPNEPQANPSKTRNANVNENVNVNVNENEKENEECGASAPDFPSLLDYPNQPKTNAGKDLDRIREHWNSQPVLPKFRHLVISMPPDQTGPALRTLGTYTADEVIKAIDNYCQIIKSADHEAFPKFTGFPGFIKSGPDSYGDDAKPFDRCKIIKHEPEEDRTEREVRKAKEELAAIRARNKEAGR